MIQFGQRPKDKRESVWRGDDAVARVVDPEGYDKFGESGYLEFKPGAKPMRIVYRPLTVDEEQILADLAIGTVTTVSLYFAAGVDLPDFPEQVRMPDGQTIPRRELRGSVSCLHRRIVAGLLDSPMGGAEMIAFYATRIMEGSRPSRDDFLASSPTHTAPNSPPSLTSTVIPSVSSAVPAPSSSAENDAART